MAYLPALIEEELRAHEEALVLLSLKPEPGPVVPVITAEIRYPPAPSEDE